MSAPMADIKRPARRSARALDGEEVGAILRRNHWCVLATAADGQPYGVPVVYGYDGGAFFVASGPGRKLSNLLDNPDVCLTVAEVENGGCWRSVVVTGQARPVETLSGKLAAFNVLRRQVPGRPAPRDAARLASATVIRIDPVEITGRGLGGGERHE